MIKPFNLKQFNILSEYVFQNGTKKIEIEVIKGNKQIFVCPFHFKFETNKTYKRLCLLLLTVIYLYGAKTINIIGEDLNVNLFLKYFYLNNKKEIKFAQGLIKKKLVFNELKLSQNDIDIVNKKEENIFFDYRVGMDLGGSNIKLCLIHNEEVIKTRIIPWNPINHANPNYHYKMIKSALREIMSGINGNIFLGISSAGVFENNRIILSSLFAKVDMFEHGSTCLDMLIRVTKELNIDHFTLVNDGAITAYQGFREYNKANLLGLSLGTSIGGGYVDSNNELSTYLNEIAFVPFDHKKTYIDEWTTQRGITSCYLSQAGAINLASKLKLKLSKNKKKAFQTLFSLLLTKNKDVITVFEDLGICLGHLIGYLAHFYTIDIVYLTGGVTTSPSGEIIIEHAKRVLKEDYKKSNIEIMLSKEKDRTLSQAIAAAHLKEKSI